MNYNNLKTKLQYYGYANTPELWYGNLIGLTQFEFIRNYTFSTIKTEKKLRLGHLVERFVLNDLENDSTIEILSENIQIRKNKITIGELDCLLIQNNTPIHLEIVYKFYLYDESVGNSELEHWIGPNRNDSLIDKISKLKNKQLPLLYYDETKRVLNNLKVNFSLIEQKVLFRAQLFVPINLINKTLRLINNSCIMGFYIAFDNLEVLKNELFHIPNKLDWLANVNDDVLWLNYNSALSVIEESIKQNRSVLCWIKNKDLLQKIFIVWWP